VSYVTARHSSQVDEMIAAIRPGRLAAPLTCRRYTRPTRRALVPSSSNEIRYLLAKLA
jgi:hypothetical protein